MTTDTLHTMAVGGKTMDRNKLTAQVIICLGIFAAVQIGPAPGEGRIGGFLDKLGEAIQENYTLEELFELSQDAVSAAVSAPLKVSEAVLEANEKVQYGKPLDENSGDDMQPVYAVAGGKVLLAGIREDIGMYVKVEHPEKISTYGHLSNAAVITGDRVKKGDILGSYDPAGAAGFYYVLEEKSANLD